MNLYELPISLTVGRVEREIRSDFRAVLDILVALNDPDLDGQTKNAVFIQIMYPGWAEIPPEDMPEALDAACEFIDHGQEDDGRKRPRLIDWEKDADLIIPAVNSVAHDEVRVLPYLHWWTFLGYFMEIGDSTFSTVLNVRKKKAKCMKLEKWEESFYKENRKTVDLTVRCSQEDREALEKLFGELFGK